MVVTPIKEAFTLGYLVQDNNGGDPDLLSIGEIEPRHQKKIRWGFRVLKVQGEWKS